MSKSVEVALTLRASQGICSLEPAQWQPLVAAESPFLSYSFLSELERAGCVGEESAWTPMILTAWLDDALVGALPMYLKADSAGEFVFDWSWAEAAHRAGINYYPKAVVAVPFSPVTGRRLLVHPEAAHPDAIARALVAASLQLMRDARLSSLHYNFVMEQELPLLESCGLMRRHGMQYHWYNADAMGQPYADFDGWLERFRAKQRANIRRERRKLHERGVTTRVVQGDAIDEALMRRMFVFYRNTVHKFYWGHQYLNERFFLGLLDSPARQYLHFVVASRDGEDFAGAFNMLKDGRLYGRYWGSTREEEFAHFEVCMYAAIDWCIAHGVAVFEPGAGGEHKYERGFAPTVTYSAHEVRDVRLRDAVGQFLAQERAHVVRQAEQLRLAMPGGAPGEPHGA